MPEIAESVPRKLAPLPVPEASPSLQRIRRPRKPEPAGAPAAMIPLFHAALLFFAGIVLAHYCYFRPTCLLVGLIPLAMVAVSAIRNTPRLSWLPIAAIWMVLGIWSAETEPDPAPNPEIAQLSDGLLRTVEGTVIDSGPVRGREAWDETLEDREAESTSEAPGQQIQRVDIQLTSAEVVTGASDAIVPIPASQTARIRLSVTWPSLPATAIRCGQRLRAVVRILPPDTFHDPGVWSLATYLESQQITASSMVSRRHGTCRSSRSIPNSRITSRSSASPCA